MKKIISFILAIILGCMFFSLPCLAAENAEGEEESQESETSKVTLPVIDDWCVTVAPDVYSYNHYCFSECRRAMSSDDELWYDTFAKKIGDFVRMDRVPVPSHFGSSLEYRAPTRDPNKIYLVKFSDDIYIQLERCTHARVCKEDFDLITSTVEKRNLKDMTKIFPDEAYKGSPAFFKQGKVIYVYYPKTVTDEDGTLVEQMTLQYIGLKKGKNEFVAISLEHGAFFDKYNRNENDPTILDFILDATTVERAVEYLYSENVSLENAFPEFFAESSDGTSRTDIISKGFWVGGITAVAIIGATVPLVIYSVKKKKR